MASVRGKPFQTDRPELLENDTSPNVFLFTQAVTKVWMSDTDHNCPVGEEILKHMQDIHYN